MTMAGCAKGGLADGACAVDADCDDDLFCNGAETCDTAASSCVPGTPPDVDDGVACTDDSCDEINDEVVNEPNDGNCADELFCNGDEVCDAELGCLAGTPPTIEDGIACTNSVCDETNDAILIVPDDNLCSDGNVCNGAETCDPLNDCIAGTPILVPVDVTQSTNTSAITTGNSVSCNLNNEHADNSYYRVFDLSVEGLICDYAIASVDIGIESATAGSGGSQPMTVTIHSLSGPLLLANLTPIATVNINVTNQNNTILNVPITATVAATDTIVLEVFTPDGQAANHSLFIGSNNLGQSGPSFLRAPECGANEPTDVSTLGFPEMQLVMTINGTSAGG